MNYVSFVDSGDRSGTNTIVKILQELEEVHFDGLHHQISRQLISNKAKCNLLKPTTISR